MNILKKCLLSIMIALMMTSSFTVNIFAEDEEVEEVEKKNGWIEENNQKYYYIEDEYVTGKKTIEGKTYYFNSKGVMQTGWVKIDGVKTYFDNKGVLYTGLLDQYYIKKGLIQKNVFYNQRYYKSNGKYATGLLKVKGYYYYFKNNGKYTIGWKKIKKKKYYFKSNGQAVTKTLKLNGVKYYFNKKGVLYKQKDLNVKEKMNAKAQKYTSPTKNLILVNTKNHKVAVYKGSKNNWKNVRYFSCGDGKASTPTVKGTFHVGSHGKYFKAYYFDADGGARCFYPTRITGNYLFHSVLYYRTPNPTSILDGRVGVGVSHGCVRCLLKDAKWIHDHIQAGTTVVIY